MTRPLDPIDRRFSVAPMMDWTDRHCRAFHRVLTRKALLYTEMAVDQAVIHGDRERLIGFDPAEHPVAIQLGGSDRKLLVQASKIAEDFGYAEINLNVGCPSDRVQSGRFGACLMKDPQLVAECLAAMREAVTVPVTVKHRLGVDDQDPEEAVFRFVETVKGSGVTSFTIHARMAWLEGLSPKENRDVPPLDYALVRQVKSRWPELEIILNGGLKSLSQAIEEKHDLDGIMLGRAAYQTPWELADVDNRMFGQNNPVRSRDEAVEVYKPYIARRLSEGVRLHAITRHMLGLYHGQPGGRLWRQVLSTEAPKPGAGLNVIDQALGVMREAAAA